MGRTTRLIAAVLVLPLALTALPAGAEEISTPEGRARLEATPSQEGDTGRLEVEGNVGAFGFRGAAEGSPNHLRVEDPPSYGALQLDPDGLHMEYEETFGPRIANATIGTGGMTEGLDAHGRVTNLGWPDPGLYEHVNSLNVSRRWPNQGIPENAGSFGGVVIDGEPTWLHPSFGWEQEAQRYASEDSQTVVTVLRRGEGKAQVQTVITDVVHPDREIDLIARNFRFTGPGARDIEDFVYYANMNPTTSRAPRVPSIFDGAADNASDFGTAYDPDASSMLHFRPYRVDPASLSRLATSQPSAETAEEAVRGSFGDGVYIAVAGQGDATAAQAGQESGGLVREGPQADPFYDFAADGELSGAPAAFGKTAGALRLPPDQNGSYTVYLAADETPDDARKRIKAARELGFGKIKDRSETYWSEWLADARLPDAGGAVGAVGKRGLMAIRTAQSRLTGAIVANTTTQTPYRQDWIRDGAFFNYALLLAGKTEMVLEHNAFYDGIYRPGGTWDTLYYTDGAEAGFTFPYEIDTQAFAVWALWLPYAFRETAFADGETEEYDDAEDYLRDVYPAIRDTAEAIMLCRDPLNDLQCYAAEDDAFQPSQGPQGASTVYLALQAAAEAADVLERPADRDRWRARAVELREAAVQELCSADNPAGETHCGGGRGGIYMAWPSNLLADAAGDPEVDFSEADLQDHLRQYVRRLDRQSRIHDRKPDAGGFFQYPMEPILALAPQWGHHAKAERLSRWIDWLATEVAEPGVLHYGERIYRCDGQGPCEADQEYLHTVGFPHIWSGVEQYMASAFVHGLDVCPEGVTQVGEAACP